MAAHKNEAFARVLIDRALTDGGWDLLDPQQVLFEYHMPTGRADYLLKGKLGRVLCDLEAKREDVDPYDAKEQARGYAENVKAPFIILSNGREHWFWNYQRADQQDAYRIERLPSREDLERLLLKNLQPPRPLQSEVIKPDYLRHLKHDLTLRGYQIRAMDEIARLFDEKSTNRKFLCSKWRPAPARRCCAPRSSAGFCSPATPSASCSSLTASNSPKQTMEDFNVVLAEFKPVIYKTARRTGRACSAPPSSSPRFNR